MKLRRWYLQEIEPSAGPNAKCRPHRNWFYRSDGFRCCSVLGIQQKVQFCTLLHVPVMPYHVSRDLISFTPTVSYKIFTKQFAKRFAGSRYIFTQIACIKCYWLSKIVRGYSYILNNSWELCDPPYSTSWSPIQQNFGTLFLSRNENWYDPPFVKLFY
jgi:hypothetical protein